MTIPSSPFMRQRLLQAGFCLAAAVAAQPAFGQDVPSAEGSPQNDIVAEQTPTRLDDSGNAHTGVFHLNQASADGAQQDNTLAVASIAGTGAALAEAATSQNSADTNFTSGPQTDVQISGVANQLTGLAGINQSAAIGSSQANVAVVASSRAETSIALASAQAQMGAVRIGVSIATEASSASIDNFANDASGLVQANQAAGIGGQQLNLIAIASAGDGIADSSVVGGLSGESNVPLGILPIVSASGNVSLTESFNGMMGIAQVNQVAGSNNLQSNLVAAAFGSNAFATAVSDSSLGAVNTASAASGNDDGEAQEFALGIAGSFEGFSGIGQVSQVVGSNNITSNTVAVSVTHIPAGLP